jgi:uncharacterized protein YcfL
VLLVISGCKTVNTTQRANPRSSPDIVNDERIITDGSLNQAARIQAVNEGTTGGDLLKIQVAVRNTTTSRQRFNYRFEWFNKQGMRIDTKLSSWQPETLHGKETKWLQAVAPTPDAVDFQLKLVEAGS